MSMLFPVVNELFVSFIPCQVEKAYCSKSKRLELFFLIIRQGTWKAFIFVSFFFGVADGANKTD
jgi:hypothetical protein